MVCGIHPDPDADHPCHPDRTEALPRELGQSATDHIHDHYLCHCHSVALLATGRAARVSAAPGALLADYRVIPGWLRHSHYDRENLVHQKVGNVGRELTAGLGKWQVSKLIENDEVEAGQMISDPPLPLLMKERAIAKTK